MDTGKKEALDAYFREQGYENHALKTIIEKIIETPEQNEVLLTEKEFALLQKLGVQRILDEMLKDLGIEKKLA